MQEEKASELARGWIHAWVRMDMEWLKQHLTPDFVHISPFGRFSDRETYLEAVEPLARKSVLELKVQDVIASGNQAAIRFQNCSAEGVVDTCDWIRIQDGRIKEIRSFYDTARIRKILSSSEQKSLNGAPQRVDPEPAG